MLSSALKRLSENDVGATRSHQAGFLIPKELVNNGLFEVLPTDILNPRLKLKFVDLSDQSALYLSYIFYNNRNFGGTRLEYRLTGLTRWIKKHGLRSGDVLQISRTAQHDYSVDILKGERKPSNLSDESWVALYGEEKKNGE
jgi:hypothetical protein